MKTSTGILEKISKEELDRMTKEIKETLASEYADRKTFSSLDLWNIHRQRRVLPSRRSNN